MVETTPGSRELQCVVVTPERALLDEKADFVVVPMADGELGILPGRAALIGRLGAGEFRIRKGNTVQRFFVDGGFVQVRGNTVTVLTPRALKADEIKPQKVRETLEELRVAHGKADSEEAVEASLKTMERARAQLRVARHAGGEGRAPHV